MPVAALAVMKCGAVAVATDVTTQPEERLLAMVEQVGSSMCLSSVKHKDLASRLCTSVTVVGPALLHRSPHVNGQPLPQVSPDDALLIQFTSGSTGTPKGVVVTHENMCSALAHQRDALGYRQDSRVLDFSSYALDVFWANLLAQAPEQDQANKQREPHTGDEKLFQKLWAEILKLDPATIGVDGGFFRLGGDSIGAMRVDALARQNGLPQLTVRDVFRHPLLRDLASAVEAS